MEPQSGNISRSQSHLPHIVIHEYSIYVDIPTWDMYPIWTPLVMILSLASHTDYFNDNIICHFAASMISGLVTTIASMPVDIAKTR